jgi:hypothetical protein
MKAGTRTIRKLPSNYMYVIFNGLMWIYNKPSRYFVGDKVHVMPHDYSHVNIGYLYKYQEMWDALPTDPSLRLPILTGEV